MKPHGETCITCGDVAVEAVVLAVRDDATALVRADCREEEVAVELLDRCAPGDTILVHAGVAIVRVS